MEEEAVRSCETEEGDFVPARPETPSPEEDSSDEDQVSKAFKRLKRSREEMSSRKKKRRIRMPDSSSEEETVREDQSEYYKVFEKGSRSVVRRIISSEEDESNNDVDDNGNDSFINDEDEDEVVDDESWRGMMARLERRDEKYQGLTSQYEEAILDNRVSGGRYDVSDEEEERVNKYPEKLLASLREAAVDANTDDGRASPEEVHNNDLLVQMWEMYDYREDKEKEGECVCGQTGLRHLFFMRLSVSKLNRSYVQGLAAFSTKIFVFFTSEG